MHLSDLLCVCAVLTFPVFLVQYSSSPGPEEWDQSSGFSSGLCSLFSCPAAHPCQSVHLSITMFVLTAAWHYTQASICSVTDDTKGMFAALTFDRSWHFGLGAIITVMKSKKGEGGDVYLCTVNSNTASIYKLETLLFWSCKQQITGA